MTYEDFNIKVPYGRTGNIKVICPECQKTDRKNKTDKSLSVNLDQQVWNCHYCNWTGTLKTKNEKTYVRPVWQNNTELSNEVVKFFEKRKISQFTLRNMKVTQGLEFMPQLEKEVNTIKFNYFRDEKLINVKYRAYPKYFKLHKDSELIFYNLDAIKETTECIIVEGEIDQLSYFEAGLRNCISVPNGANKNLQYLDNCISYFDNKEKIYIATDNDAKGIELKNELIRRLGAERCFIVDFEDCKDANEYLVKYNIEKLKETITNAKTIKIEGIIKVEDFEIDLDLLWKNGLQKGLTIGFEDFDNICSWITGRLCTVTGIPGHGKSEFIDEIIIRLNLFHKWKFAYFSPENFPLQIHASKLISKVTGKYFNSEELNQTDYINSKQYLNENFYFIAPVDENYTLDNILAKAKYLIKTKGIKSIVIDPWNRLEHQISSNQTETNYISQQLDKLTNFAQKNDILIFLIAHPTKLPKFKGVHEIPNMYSISGSANFFNKTDYGICVYRDYGNETVQVHVQKVKFKHLGEVGLSLFKYNKINGRYVNLKYVEDTPEFDNKNYLKHSITGVDEKQKSINLDSYHEPIKPNYEFETEGKHFEHNFDISAMQDSDIPF